MSIQKEAKNFLHFLDKKWNYSRDLLREKDLEKVHELRSDLQKIAKGKVFREDAEQVFEQTPKQLEKFWPGCTKPNPWAENIEVFFVALVIAFALRCYFVQPFKIPTDSMKPTLWGIYPESIEGDGSPNILKQVVDYAVGGKSYHKLVADQDGILEKVEAGPSYLFLGTTKIRFAGHEHTMWTDFDTFKKLFGGQIPLGKQYQKGDVIANFSVQAGDHIFVNKVAYNFRLPKQGEVFVFTTKDIRDPQLLYATKGVTQYYIKRCVGVPGVTLKVSEPYLYSNNQILESRAFERIYSKQDGYRGYFNAGNYMATANDEVYIPEDKFWAMGDNSANSLDSRYWKYVPRQNLVGTAFIVYWPITSRWGFIQ